MLTSQYAPECTPYGAAVSPPPPEPVADGDGLSGGALVGAAVGGAVLDGAAVGGVPAVGCGTEAPPAGCGWACPSGPPDLPGPGEPEAPGEAVPPGTAGDGDIPSFPRPTGRSRVPRARRRPVRRRSRWRPRGRARCDRVHCPH